MAMTRAAAAPPSILDVCRDIFARHEGRAGSLLPILHDVQSGLGCVPPQAVAVIADHLNLTRAEVHGTVSFYHDFREEPAGRRLVKLCQAEACQARGARLLTAAVEQRLGLTLGETSPDRSVTLEPAYCLGLCASGPAALVNGRPVARLAPDALDSLCEGAGT
jgi:formate dehydrogenase subunit gamma